MQINLKLKDINVEDFTNTLTKNNLEFIAETILNRLMYTNEKRSITVEIKTVKVTTKNLTLLRKVATQYKMTGLQRRCSEYLNVISDVSNSIIKGVPPFEKALIDFFLEKCINGWVFYKECDGSFNPYVIQSIKYEASKKYSPESVLLVLKSSNPVEDDVETKNIPFCASDVKNKTIINILKEKGLYYETDALLNEYYGKLELFKKYNSTYGKQYVATGKMMVNNKNYSFEPIGSNTTNLINNNQFSKTLPSSCIDSYFWEKYNNKLGTFENIPFLPYINFFDLEKHEFAWVISNHIEPYVYDSSIKDKIVLPENHSQLLNILVDDMEFIQEDIVDGKTGGTVILCLGRAGLGKTLTAEAYSEIVEKPLYRVHSGQLGQSPEDIEKNLKIILNRSQSWGSILLIDEADVYIRERDNSMSHNAVVACFLRQLEYFSGLLFLTSNRVNDIDDAIRSRCSATIKYAAPPKKDLIRIWEVLSAQYEVVLSGELIQSLVDKYPNCSGRDIKELLKLACKYHRNSNAEYSLTLFENCATFRGL